MDKVEKVSELVYGRKRERVPREKAREKKNTTL